MTDQQIEQIAEAVFQKMLAKQEEWDKASGCHITFTCFLGFYYFNPAL